MNVEVRIKKLVPTITEQIESRGVECDSEYRLSPVSKAFHETKCSEEISVYALPDFDVEIELVDVHDEPRRGDVIYAPGYIGTRTVFVRRDSLIEAIETSMANLADGWHRLARKRGLPLRERDMDYLLDRLTLHAKPKQIKVMRVYDNDELVYLFRALEEDLRHIPGYDEKLAEQSTYVPGADNYKQFEPYVKELFGLHDYELILNDEALYEIERAVGEEFFKKETIQKDVLFFVSKKLLDYLAEERRNKALHNLENVYLPAMKNFIENVRLYRVARNNNRFLSVWMDAHAMQEFGIDPDTGRIAGEIKDYHETLIDYYKKIGLPEEAIENFEKLAKKIADIKLEQDASGRFIFYVNRKDRNWRLEIPSEHMGQFIGKGGKNVKRTEELYGVRIKAIPIDSTESKLKTKPRMKR